MPCHGLRTVRNLIILRKKSKVGSISYDTELIKTFPDVNFEK
mgnify:CR=1 FL=1